MVTEAARCDRGCLDMNPSQSGTPLIIQTLDDLVAMVPFLLGFHPHESLVVIVMDDTGIQLTGRIDLSDAAQPDHLADLVGRLAHRFATAEQWFLAFSADPEIAWRVLGECAELVGALRLGRLLQVDAQSWRADDRHGESGWVGANCVATQAAALGMSARASRTELTAQVAGPDDAEVAALLAEFDQAHAWAQSLTAAERRQAAVRLTRTATQQRDLVRLAVLASDPTVQVAVLRSLDRDNAAAAVACWTAVVAHSLTPYLVGPLGLLGVASWLTGDGATQNVCLERLDQLQPLAPLAALLDWINQKVLPPSAWAQHQSVLLGALIDQSRVVGHADPRFPGV